MKRRAKIRFITFALSLLLVGAGLLADARLALAHSSTRLEYSYRRALGDLTDGVGGMCRTLEKAQYASTPVMQSALSAQLLEQSGSAKSAMATLPFSQEKTEAISRFLSQAGDYALSLTRRSFSSQPLAQEDLEGFSTLAQYAEKLYGSLTAIQARLTAEGGSLYQMETLLNRLDSTGPLSLLDDGFDNVAKEFASIPALLYDGPFSDHIPQRQPLHLQNKPALTQEQAAQKAAAFLQCDPSSLTFTGEGGAQLPVFQFSWDGQQIHITRQGGQPAYYKKEHRGSENLTQEEALTAARSALKGLPPMEESYYVKNDGVLTINFHTTTAIGGQEALCYPDLIKVSVELEQGGLVEYDAAGYLMNHHQRALAAPALTQRQAEESLSPLLTLQSARLAVIPTPGLEEVLCWEFSCKGKGGRQVLSYINAETGLEEQLYLLQEDAHGVLAV